MKLRKTKYDDQLEQAYERIARLSKDVIAACPGTEEYWELQNQFAIAVLAHEELLALYMKEQPLWYRLLVPMLQGVGYVIHYLVVQPFNGVKWLAEKAAAAVRQDD